MNEIDWLNILKWVVIVLVAGFIGQFGKSFAKHLMEKARRRGEKAADGDTEIVIAQNSLPEAEAVPDEGRNLTPEEAKERAKQEKKMAKAIAKQKKKEAKALEKEGK